MATQEHQEKEELHKMCQHIKMILAVYFQFVLSVYKMLPMGTQEHQQERKGASGNGGNGKRKRKAETEN